MFIKAFSGGLKSSSKKGLLSAINELDDIADVNKLFKKSNISKKLASKLLDDSKFADALDKPYTKTASAAKEASSAVEKVAEASTSTATAVAEVGTASAASSASMTTMEAATAGLATEETVATGATVGFGTAIKGFLVTVAPIAAALVAVGVAFKLAHDYVTKFDDAVEKAETSQSNFEQTKSELSSLQDELDSTKDKIKELKSTTSFAWTDVITNSCTCTTYKNMLVKNDGDDLNDYSYPTIRIHPTKDEEIFICNESDYTLLENGKISVASDDVFNTIIDKAENYAKLNGYDLEYTGKGAFNIVSICNDTGVQFKLIDNYGCETLCTVFYNTDTKEYKIISGGFMYMKVYKDLDVVIDCKNMTIEDSIGRMVTYDKIGISDIGYMYWLRLMNGNNSIMFHGNCEFTIEHIEARKVGE